MSSERPTVTSQPPTPPPPNFIAILREMLSASDKVSDLIFSPGRPPQIELAGKLVPVKIAGLEKLTPAHTAGIAKLIIGNQQTAVDSLEKTGSADLSFSAPGDARFRVNIFKQRGTHAIVMRAIPMRRARLGQAPKVILVGKMRDRETIEVALEAAETGHLVLSTLHTIDASKTVDR